MYDEHPEHGKVHDACERQLPRAGRAPHLKCTTHPVDGKARCSVSLVPLISARTSRLQEASLAAAYAA